MEMAFEPEARRKPIGLKRLGKQRPPPPLEVPVDVAGNEHANGALAEVAQRSTPLEVKDLLLDVRCEGGQRDETVDACLRDAKPARDIVLVAIPVSADRRLGEVAGGQRQGHVSGVGINPLHRAGGRGCDLGGHLSKERARLGNSDRAPLDEFTSRPGERLRDAADHPKEPRREATWFPRVAEVRAGRAPELRRPAAASRSGSPKKTRRPEGGLWPRLPQRAR